MDADSFDAQGDSCETMSAAVYGYQPLILLRPAPGLAAAKRGQSSTLSVLPRLVVLV